jgi:hypothetical protein
VNDETKQCPACGRVNEDWSSNRDDGPKARQRSDKEDRTLAYRDWRRTAGQRLYVMDFDQVEWRVIDGKFEPVAIVELTMVNGTIRVPQGYLDAIITRFTERDGQASILREAAERMRIKAWITLFRWDLSEFWIYNLSENTGWWHVDQHTYINWLEKMETQK